MGYTKGRRLTNEFLILEAKKYKTKSEMNACDSSILQTARKRGIVKEVTSHMESSNFSVPQLMCKLILETVIGTKCMYDTRQIVKPYELDIYFPEYKLAVEYSGDYWHQKEEVLLRDKAKKQKCIEMGITLLTVEMEHRRWEEDVKNQLVNFLPIINTIINKNIVENDIRKIDCKDIYKNLSSIKDIESIKEKIKNCKSPSEFTKKYYVEYNYLRKSKQLHLLNNIRIRRKTYTKEEILRLCKDITDRSIFIKEHFWLYYRCSKYGILKQATKHMNKNTKRYELYTNSELLTHISPKWITKNDLRKNNLPLHREILKRNLMNECNFKPKKA